MRQGNTRAGRARESRSVVDVYQSDLPVLEDTHEPCAFMAGPVTAAVCSLHTSVPRKNTGGCMTSRCASPWRLCLHCTLLGQVDATSRCVNPQSGSCAFHEEHGANASKKSPTPEMPAPMAVPTVYKQKTEATSGTARANARAPDVIGKLLAKAIAEAEGPFIVSTDTIRRYEGQPRHEFEEADIAELAEGIRVGQMQSAYVRRVSDDPKHEYELIDGERRWLACTLIGLPLRVLVLAVSDADLQFVMAVAANFGRKDHSALEIAEMLGHMVHDLGWKVEEAVKVCGKGPAWGYQYLKLLKLDPRVKVMLSPSLPRTERISPSICWQLASLPHEDQVFLAQRIVQEKLPLHRAQQLINQHVHKHGIRKEGARKRSPSDDYALLMGAIRSMNGRVASLLEISPEQLAVTLRNRSMATQRELVANLSDFEANVAAFRQAIERAWNES